MSDLINLPDLLTEHRNAHLLVCPQEYSEGPMKKFGGQGAGELWEFGALFHLATLCELGFHKLLVSGHLGVYGGLITQVRLIKSLMWCGELASTVVLPWSA